MPSKDPIVQSFVILCFGAALLLVYLEWQDPFYLKTIQTPASTPRIQDVSSADTSGTNASKFTRPKWLTRFFAPPNPPESDTRLVVSLSQRQVTLYQHQAFVKHYPVAIGQAEWQTPIGTFTVQNMQKDPAWQHPITDEVIAAGPDNPLGSRWIGFWQDGSVQIGFHGTNQSELIGQAVSHGCIRMLNQDIELLYEEIGPGAVVVVEP